MPGNDDRDTIWKKHTDPYTLTNAMQSSYDQRVHVARGFILFEAQLADTAKETKLREDNPALTDAWEKYNILLKLVKK